MNEKIAASLTLTELQTVTFAMGEYGIIKENSKEIRLLFDKLMNIQKNIELGNPITTLPLKKIEMEDTVEFTDMEGVHYSGSVVAIKQTKNPDFPILNLICDNNDNTGFRCDSVPHISHVKPKIYCWERITEPLITEGEETSDDDLLIPLRKKEITLSEIMERLADHEESILDLKDLESIAPPCICGHDKYVHSIRGSKQCFAADFSNENEECSCEGFTGKMK